MAVASDAWSDAEQQLLEEGHDSRVERVVGKCPPRGPWVNRRDALNPKL